MTNIDDLINSYGNLWEKFNQSKMPFLLKAESRNYISYKYTDGSKPKGYIPLGSILDGIEVFERRIRERNYGKTI